MKHTKQKLTQVTSPPPREIGIINQMNLKAVTSQLLQRNGRLILKENFSRWKFCICKSALVKTGVAEIRSLFQMKARNYFSSFSHQMKNAYFILKMDKWWLMALKRAPNKPPENNNSSNENLRKIYILK